LSIFGERRPRLIATDLDGTIVAHYGGITDRTKAAITEAHNAGIEIFFVTGRPPRWMPEIAAAFPFGNSICGNGALHYDIHNQKVLEEWLMPIENQIETVNRLRLAIPTISFAVESHHYFHREKAYIPRWDAGLDNIGVHDITEVMQGPAMKILARCSQQELTSDQMLEIALREISDVATVTHSNSHDSLLEINAPGISKGHTLSLLAERLGISAEDSVSFGDNPNDFTMLSWAGRSWAMQDGHPDGPRYAKSVADPHQEDGVAKVIEKLLELPA
jgi:Cof subfamily protein (haloacid dehalogenase superfamily)